jgi:hypothetical protein
MKTLATFGIAAACVAGVSGGVLPDCTKPPLSLNKVCDRKATPRERATAFIEALEIDEKLANIVR